MKALAVQQPWAYALVDGAKAIEVRSWKTDHRGQVLITASARPSNVFWDQDGDGQTMRLLHAGCMIGIVDLVDCRPMRKADADDAMGVYESGSFAWVVEPVGFVVPRPLRSRLNLFEVPDADIVRLRGQVLDGDWLFAYDPPQGVVPFTARCPVIG